MIRFIGLSFKIYLWLIIIFFGFVIDLFSQVTYDNWDIKISGKNILVSDTLARIGIRQNATSGFDNLYDIPRPPRSPSGVYLEIYFPHSGGNFPQILGSKYAVDFQNPNDPIWNMSVESSSLGTITIFWDSLQTQAIEKRLQLFLLDLFNGELTDMRDLGSYTFNYTAKRNFQILGAVKINLTYLMEAFWNGTTQIQDTVSAFLAYPSRPFYPADSTKLFLSNSGQGMLVFPNASSGSYYLVIKHRNHLEVWTSAVLQMTKGTTSFSEFDFSASANTAYGTSALKQLGDVFVSWAGDVNQDGIVDFIDRNLTWNNRGQTGYLPTDCTGDGITDSFDYNIVLANRLKYVQKP
jgi:hypothetical protein